MSTIMPPSKSDGPAPRAPAQPSAIREPPASAPPSDAPPAAPPSPPQPVPLARRFTVRRLALLAVVLVLGLGIAYAMRPRPIAVDVDRAARRPMTVTVDADAVTRVRDHFTVTAPVGGLVQRIALREGDPVTRGQVVATISPAPSRPSEVTGAEARTTAAIAGMRQGGARASQAASALGQAVRDAERTRRLAQAGALAQRDVENAEQLVTARRADREAALAQLTAARAELAAARSARDATVGASGTSILVHAPAAGRVLRVPDPNARVVLAGAPLLQVGDPSSLEVVADVLSSDAASLRPGQRVLLQNSGAGVLRGVVRVVEPAATTRVSALGVEEQRLAAIIAVDATPATLGDNFKLDASIIVWEGRDVLTIPAGALLREDDGYRVFVTSDGRARRRAVRIGHVGGGLAEVLGGLSAGETVIVFPPDEVKEGARVTASNQGRR